MLQEEKSAKISGPLSLKKMCPALINTVYYCKAVKGQFAVFLLDFLFKGYRGRLEFVRP
jgi:hypothetical protein